jgi:glycosyltransferase involved in cell wall biosynthesis
MSEITLAIPYYRGRDYLRSAIESVFAQQSPEGAWNLLVVDDGERSEAHAVLRELGIDASDERVRCIENAQNLGMVGNWNRCLDEATSPLVSLLHADDMLGPNYVATQLRLADANPEATAFFCGARIIDAHGTECFSFADWIKRFFLPPQARASHDYPLCGEDALCSVMAGNFIMCPTLCFRLAKLGERRFDPAWHQVQDLDFTARLLLEGDTLVGTADVAYAYRRHEEGATAVQSESGLRFEEEFALFERVASRADDVGWNRAAATARRKSIIRLHLLYRALGSAGALRFDQAAAQLRMALTGRSSETDPPNTC